MKYVPKIYAILLFLMPVLHPLPVRAQNEEYFEPGYIITMDGDTIYGEIKQRVPWKNSKSCIFRAAANEKPVEYMPFDILSYRFEKGKYYISKMVPVGDKKEPMFLEFLVEGEANLYVYRDMEKDHYLVERKGQPLVELKNEKKVVEREDGFYASYSREYIGALRYLFSDYQSLYPEINSLKLEDKDLIKFAKDFHAKACEGEKCIVYEKKFHLQKMKVRFAPVVGMNVAFLGYHSDDGDDAEELDYEPSLSVAPGLGITFWFDQKELLGIGLFVAYMSNVYHGESTLDNTNAITYREAFTDVSNVRAGLWFKGVFLSGKVRPYYFVGGMMNWTFSQNTEYLVTDVVRSTVVTNHGEKEGGPAAGYNIGPAGGLGMEIPLKHFSPFFEGYCEALLFSFGEEEYSSSNISTGLRVGISF